MSRSCSRETLQILGARIIGPRAGSSQPQQAPPSFSTFVLLPPLSRRESTVFLGPLCGVLAEIFLAERFACRSMIRKRSSTPRRQTAFPGKHIYTRDLWRRRVALTMRCGCVLRRRDFGMSRWLLGFTQSTLITVAILGARWDCIMGLWRLLVLELSNGDLFCFQCGGHGKR